MTVMQNTGSVLGYTDVVRRSIAARLPKKQKLEQYFSSAPLAHLMASMMDYPQKEIRILDPGAGIGSLFVACVEEICKRGQLPRRIAVTAYEVDPVIFDSLEDSSARVRDLCDGLGVEFSSNLKRENFVAHYAKTHGTAHDGFTHVIMNPPYRKIGVSSRTYATLSRVNLQTVNMYAAFVAISHNLLEDSGQMTFISPRSFCNGAYFHSFRKNFLESMSIRRIHLFSSRSSSFRDDGVLQENVIVHAKKRGRHGAITVSSSLGPGDRVRQRRVRNSDVVFDGDPQYFIHIVPDGSGARASKMVNSLECTLEDLGISVSTGRVVDFRSRDELRSSGVDGAVPLVRPFNISGGTVTFPIEGRKHHNFIMESAKSRRLLVENGNYVLVKRFTTVEEKKRVVAAVWTKKEYGTHRVGFENRTNYFHRNGGGLEFYTARGLCAFLNSSVVDTYIRQFNGNTQINATDLRYLRYPSTGQLEQLGRMVGDDHNQKNTGEAIERLLFDGTVMGS